MQRYRHRDGRIDEYSHLHADVRPVITLPIAMDGHVIAQREFRYGVGLAVLEVSGGNAVPAQPPERVAAKELEEETGYVPGRLIGLSQEVYPDPASVTFSMALYLALDCKPSGRQKLDAGEYIEIVSVPLPEWLRMIFRGDIKDLKTIAITLLALPHLGYPFPP